MNFDALAKAVENWQPTEQDIKNLEKRLTEAEAKFAEESRRKRITQEWLNKEYTI